MEYTKHDINEELKTLDDLYQYDLNFKNKILTGNPDTDFYILKTLDLKTLYRFCSTNVYANKICNSQLFWYDKMSEDQLPVFLMENNDSTNYFDTYRLLEKVKFISTGTLLVNSIEVNRKVGPTNGIIHIDIVNSDVAKKILSAYKTLQSKNLQYIRIKLTFIDDNAYQMNVRLDNGSYILENEIINYNDILNIIQKAYYNILSRNPSSSVRDTNDITFTTTNIRIIDINIQYRPTVNVGYLYRRLGIWDSIRHNVNYII